MRANGQLDFREVRPGIAPEQHSRTFDIDLSRGQLDLVTERLQPMEQLGVGTTKLVVVSLVHQAQARGPGQFPDVDTLDSGFSPSRKAHLEVRVVFAIPLIVVEAKWLVAKITTDGFAEPSEPCSTLTVLSFHPDAGDENWF